MDAMLIGQDYFAIVLYSPDQEDNTIVAEVHFSDVLHAKEWAERNVHLDCKANPSLSISKKGRRMRDPHDLYLQLWELEGGKWVLAEETE